MNAEMNAECRNIYLRLGNTVDTGNDDSYVFFGLLTEGIEVLTGLA